MVAVAAEMPDRMNTFDNVTVVVVLLSFARPGYFEFLGFGDLLQGLNAIAAVLILVAVFRRRAVIDAFVLLWLMVCFWILLTSFVNGADMSAAFAAAARIGEPALLVAAYRDSFPALLRIVYVVLGLIVVANFVSIVLFPNGMYETGITNVAYENWLIGFKNRQIVVFLPLLLSTLLLGSLEGFSFDKLIAFIVVGVSVVLINSSTAIVCFVLIVILGVLPTLRSRYSIFNSATFFITAMVLFVLVVVLRAQNAFSFFVTRVLGKDLTFTNRTELWDTAISRIRERPIIGWGELSIADKHDLYSSYSVISPHNQLLEYAFTGGLILVGLYVLVNIRLVVSLNRCASEPAVQLASAVYFGMLVVMLTESYSEPLFYLLYSMIWLAPTLARSCTPKDIELRRDR